MRLCVGVVKPPLIEGHNLEGEWARASGRKIKVKKKQDRLDGIFTYSINNTVFVQKVLVIIDAG